MQMYNASFNVLGLMSGTSLDGMDAAVVQFSNVTDPHWKLLYFKCLPYPEALKKQIEAAYENASLSDKASAAFAQWSIDVIQAVQADFDGTIDLVASHGQTIFHKPEKKFTYQAGCLPEIAAATKLPLVTNFRVQDVLLGGQGAPLVPFGDHKLFGTYEAALNLGGFANCSIGSPLLKDGVSVAFDICPANRVLNTFARELGQDYDKDGLLARQGRINPWVLDQLNSLLHSSLSPPGQLQAYGRTGGDGMLSSRIRLLPRPAPSLRPHGWGRGGVLIRSLVSYRSFLTRPAPSLRPHGWEREGLLHDSPA